MLPACYENHISFFLCRAKGKHKGAGIIECKDCSKPPFESPRCPLPLFRPPLPLFTTFKKALAESPALGQNLDWISIFWKWYSHLYRTEGVREMSCWVTWQWIGEHSCLGTMDAFDFQTECGNVRNLLQKVSRKHGNSPSYLKLAGQGWCSGHPQFHCSRQAKWNPLNFRAILSDLNINHVYFSFHVF